MRFLFFLFLIVLEAKAHPLNIGLLEIVGLNSSYSFELELHREDVYFKDLFANSLGTTLITPANVCRWSDSSVTRKETTTNILTIKAKLVCVKQLPRIDLELSFLEKMPQDFKLLTRVKIKDSERVYSNSRRLPDLVIKAHQDSNLSFEGFIRLGAAHVGLDRDQWIQDGKLRVPEGIDHLLFLLTLIISSGSLWHALKLVTGFTIGHSLSVALSMTGLNLLPPHIVEPLIALTITMMALDFMIKHSFSKKWAVILLLGFIHGFAFATAIEESGLGMASFFITLFGFNLGIEIAQVSLILLAFSFGYLLKKINLPYQNISRVTSILIAAVGFYWFIERL